DLIVIAINGWSPTQTLSPRWARRFVCFPINLETAGVKALLLFRLPLVVSPGRRDQIDAILLLTLDKLLRLCIIGISEMLCGHQILFFERLMDSRRHVHIPVASWTRLDMRNQSGSIFVTTFGQVHL